MNTIPEPDTRVVFLQPGMDFFHNGEWHVVAKVQPIFDFITKEPSPQVPPRRYVTTTDNRVFVMYDAFLVATEKV